MRAGRPIDRQKQCPHCKFLKWDDPDAPRLGEKGRRKTLAAKLIAAVAPHPDMQTQGKKIVRRGDGTSLDFNVD